jgi:cellulose synthase/poly-beta-1,6-N-acetylglucosamine synthase-like glycosyltransferase
MALLLPAHNEELIIATTIRSAVAAGQSLADIYVVDDASSDFTSQEASKELPSSNVLSVERSGKAKAVMQAINHFDLANRYTWLHIADADSIFCPDYFYIYRDNLNTKKYAAAVGFVQSMRGNWIAHYRCFSYTYGQHIFRRIQAWFGMISVLPGPVTCFRTDIIKYLDFTAESLTEDLDLTLQIHRKKLGRIKFIPEAINFTQDPRTLSDFIKQTTRWQRGFFQGIRKYKIGLRPHKIDIGIAYQINELLFYMAQLAIVSFIVISQAGNWRAVPIILVADFSVICLLAVLSAIAAKRPAILLSLPYFYFLRAIELGIFIKAFVEVIMLGRFKNEIKGWSTGSRRYELDKNVLKDVAQ